MQPVGRVAFGGVALHPVERLDKLRATVGVDGMVARMNARRHNPRPFRDGRRSIFTETFIRRVAKGWVANLHETEDEARRLFGGNYFGMRYEDLLSTPFDEMSKLWKFLGAKKISKALANDIQAEMSSNPDEEWQAQRNGDISSFLPKGQAGNWQRLFTARDKEVFKEVAGEMLVKWKYEKDLNW